MSRYVQVIITRGQPVDGPPGPIVVCTRNDSLQSIVENTPPERREGVVSRASVTALSRASNSTLQYLLIVLLMIANLDGAHHPDTLCALRLNSIRIMHGIFMVFAPVCIIPASST